MIVCPQCQSELVAQETSIQRQIRCASCGFIFASSDLKSPADPPSNRIAWWSLWLGISSIFLLFITGIPALILGICSLLKMRQQTPTYGEKNAGIIGTFLGAIFGVLLSGCLLASGSSILFTLWTMKTTTDPAEIQQMMAEVIHIDLPDNLRPSQGIQVLKSQTVLSFRDGDDDQVPTTKLQIVRARKPLTYNQQQLENLLLKKSDFPIFLELDEPTSETMVWTIDDNPTEVVHETYNARPKSEYKILREPDTKITVHRYHVISIDEDGATGISIVLEKPQSEMTPKEIRQLFESLKTLDPAS